MGGMIRRAPRDIAYCAISAVHGLAGLCLVVLWIIPSVWVAATVLGAAIGLLLTVGGLFAARLLGGLQRRTLARFAGVTVEAPPPFTPGKPPLGKPLLPLVCVGRTTCSPCRTPEVSCV